MPAEVSIKKPHFFLSGLDKAYTSQLKSQFVRMSKWMDEEIVERAVIQGVLVFLQTQVC